MNGLPGPYRDLEKNLGDVERLIEIHRQLTGDQRGRRYDVDVLNKSGIVLTVACWEAFVEDTAVAAFDFLIRNAPTPSVFPNRVLALAAEPLLQSQDQRQVFQLAGTGWQDVLRDHRDVVVADFMDGFNTPRPANVDRLFERLLGLKYVSRQWRWHKNSNPAVIKRLEELVRLRGEIAHRVATSAYVTKKQVLEAVELITLMAVITANRIRAHLHSSCDKYPWADMKVQSAE